MAQREYRTISKRAQSLLAQSEHYDIEFKESISGLKNGTIVAFANSAEGGAILVGVREETLPDGQQRGVVIGCDTSDKAKLRILNRAASTIPPVSLEVYVENIAETPFFRIEIPSGKNKPYCTGGGRYQIRGNARTNVLTPSQLLNLFMESESQQFFKRFGKVTHELEQELTEMRRQIVDDTEDISRRVSLLEGRLAQIVALVTNSAENSTQPNLSTLDAKLDQLANNLNQLLTNAD
ncbi:MAG: helix-turn-helix domain-containing protein [Candidatus Promineifilaceae bacterium]